MLQWLAFPWVRYVVWLIAGILLAFSYPEHQVVALTVGVVLVFMYLVAVWQFKTNHQAEQLGLGVLAFLLLLSLGYWRTASALQEQSPQGSAAQYWYIYVDQAPEETAKRYRVAATIQELNTEAGTSRVMVYLPKGQEQPVPGQVLLAKARLQEVSAPLNPHEFDYKSYLASQKIHHQLFVQSFVPLEKVSVQSFWKITALESRAYLLEVINRFLPDKEAVAVVKAMVLGQRSALDRTLRQAYADAGVMHVLAVSGLHVGMVFFLMSLLFAPLQHSLGKRIFWLALTLLVLWCYAWLTGLAPSAQRASVMFSIIAIGKAIQRRGNIYNSIGISAFILLLIDPLLIRQVGFQLSYLAVLGIVYLQPRISAWYQPGNAFKKKLWELFSVSLAAQLATFPLGLYYFHQFPTYFFIGNFLAVPLAFCILYGTLLLMVLHWIPLLGLAIGWLVNVLVLGLNYWVSLTEQLPLSTLTATITAPETALLYLCIISVLLFFRQRSFSWAVVSFSLMLLLASLGLMRAHTVKSQQSLTIFQIPGHTLMQFVHGQQEVLISLGERPEQQQLAYHVEPARIHAGLPPLREDQALPQAFTLPQTRYDGVRVIVWHGMRLAIVEGKELKIPALREQLEVDILLLRNNPALSLQTLAALFKPKAVVVDASNGRFFRRQVEYEANSLLLPLHITAEKGAYQYFL